MQRAFRFGLLLAVATAAIAFPCGAATRVKASPGAFLPYRSDSVSSLVQQITSNPKAAARYARHYGTTPENLVKYFRENLTLTALTKPLRTPVYYVSKSGSVQVKTRLLPAGSKVFATHDGIPILDWRCNNPLTKFLPARKVVKPPKPTPPAPVVTEVKPVPPIELGPPQLTVIAPAVETVETSVLASFPPEVTAVPAISLPPVLLTAVVPALIGAFSVHDSAAPPPVPEPSSLAGLGAAMGGFLVSLRGIKRK